MVAGRAVVFGLSHATFTSFSGIGLRVARGQPDGLTRLGFAGLGAAIVAHLLHNLFLSLGGLSLASRLAGPAGGGRHCRARLAPGAMLDSPGAAEEVRLGTLPTDQHQAIVERRSGDRVHGAH